MQKRLFGKATEAFVWDPEIWWGPIISEYNRDVEIFFL